MIKELRECAHRLNYGSIGWYMNIGKLSYFRGVQLGFHDCEREWGNGHLMCHVGLRIAGYFRNNKTRLVFLVGIKDHLRPSFEGYRGLSNYDFDDEQWFSISELVYNVFEQEVWLDIARGVIPDFTSQREEYIAEEMAGADLPDLDPPGNIRAVPTIERHFNRTELPPPPLPEIEVLRITRLHNGGNLKAFVDIRFGDIELHSLRVVKEEHKRAWVSMPLFESEKAGKKQYFPAVVLHNERLKEAIKDAVLTAWEQRN